MKRLLLLTIIAVLPISAQWRRFGERSARATGYFGIGVSTPTNPLAAHLDTGWNIAGGAGVEHRGIGVNFDAMFNDFGINHETLLRMRAGSGSQKFWALTVNPIVHVNERGPVDFYLTGGGGLYSRITRYEALSGFLGHDYGRYNLIVSDTLYKPGVNGGAGFAYKLERRSNIKLFVEARYHHMFTRGTGASFVPVTVGVRF